MTNTTWKQQFEYDFRTKVFKGMSREEITQEAVKRTNIILDYNGEKRTATQWSKILGINITTLFGRINRGWRVEKCLSKEIFRGNKYKLS